MRHNSRWADTRSICIWTLHTETKLCWFLQVCTHRRLGIHVEQLLLMMSGAEEQSRMSHIHFNFSVFTDHGLFCLGCGAGSSTQGEHEQSSLPTNTNSPGSKVSPCLVPGLLLIFHYHKIGVIILVAITLPFCLVISWSHSKLLYRMIRSKRNKGIFMPFTEIIYIHHFGPTGPFKGILRAVYPSKP